MLNDPLVFNDPHGSKSSTFAIERVVAFVLGPLLMAAAVYVVKLVTTWFPGVHLTAGQVEHVLELAMVGVILFVLKWLHGRQIPALLHTPATVLAAVQADPALLTAVAGEMGKVGAAPLAEGSASPTGGAAPPDGLEEFVDDTPPPSDFALAGSSAPLAQS